MRLMNELSRMGVLTQKFGKVPATGITRIDSVCTHRHRTRLGVLTTLPAIAGGASLGLGKLLYTFPAGVVVVNMCSMSMAIKQTAAHITADVPKVGLGTVIASGAISVLSGTATFQNLLTGQSATNCDGTATVKTLGPTAGIPFVIEAADAHTVYFNAAASWAASGDPAAILRGYVVIDWTEMV